MMLLLLLSVLPSLRARATDFFVRPTGDDALTGTSTNSSWRTIDRLNRTTFHPGDRILFEGGKSFSGNLRLTAEDSGATNAPIIIGSFGQDRATLLSGNPEEPTARNFHKSQSQPTLGKREVKRTGHPSNPIRLPSIQKFPCGKPQCGPARKIPNEHRRHRLLRSSLAPQQTKSYRSCHSPNPTINRT